MIVEHKRELRPLEDYPDIKANAPRLFKLPLPMNDATAFFDALTIIAAYLLDKDFVEGVVENEQIHYVWDLLRQTEQRMLIDRET